MGGHDTSGILGHRVTINEWLRVAKSGRLAMDSIAEVGGCRPFGAWAKGIRGLSLHHEHHLNVKGPHTMHPSVNEG